MGQASKLHLNRKQTSRKTGRSQVAEKSSGSRDGNVLMSPRSLGTRNFCGEHHYEENLRNMTVRGYTAGVYDLFHVGHLRLLKRASELCDELVVGVTADEVSLREKGKLPVVPLSERIEIISALPFVSQAIVQMDLDKVSAWKHVGFDILFVGSDWEGSEAWIGYERDLKTLGASVTYLPYTEGVSSTLLLERAAALKEARAE